MFLPNYCARSATALKLLLFSNLDSYITFLIWVLFTYVYYIALLLLLLLLFFKFSKRKRDVKRVVLSAFSWLFYCVFFLFLLLLLLSFFKISKRTRDAQRVVLLTLIPAYFFFRLFSQKYWMKWLIIICFSLAPLLKLLKFDHLVLQCQ